MSWKRPVSIVILAILAALPVSGAVCAMLCEYGTADASMASGHHHSSTRAAKTDHPSDEGRINGVSGQDCYGHDGALRQASATAAERADRGVTSVPVVMTDALTMFTLLAESGPHVEYATLGTAPPTATPLILRV